MAKGYPTPGARIRAKPINCTSFCTHDEWLTGNYKRGQGEVHIITQEGKSVGRQVFIEIDPETIEEVKEVI